MQREKGEKERKLHTYVHRLVSVLDNKLYELRY